MKNKFTWAYRGVACVGFGIIVTVFGYYALFQSDGLEPYYDMKWKQLCILLQEMEKNDTEIDLKNVIIENEQLGFKLYRPGNKIRGTCLVMTSKYRVNGVTVDKGVPLLIVFTRGPSIDGMYSILVYRHGMTFGEFGSVSEENAPIVEKFVDHHHMKKWLSRSGDLDDMIMRYMDDASSRIPRE
jgi:hypothetical protein